MAQPLFCSSNHTWNPSWADLERSVTGAACPTCGAPPALGAEARWHMGCLAALGVVALLLLVMAGPPLLILLALHALTKQTPAPNVVATVVYTYGTSLVIFFVAWSFLGRKKWQAKARSVANTLGFAYHVDAPKRLASLQALPLAEVASKRSREFFSGTFRSVEFIMGNVTRGYRKSSRTETVVFFPQSLPDLPDLDLEPERYTGLGDPKSFWNRPLLEVLGLRRPAALDDTMFTRKYRPVADPKSEKWLSPKVRETLLRHPGWAVHIRGGKFAVYRPYVSAPLLDWPAFLALAWRIRQLLATGQEGGAEAGSVSD